MEITSNSSPHITLLLMGMMAWPRQKVPSGGVNEWHEVKWAAITEKARCGDNNHRSPALESQREENHHKVKASLAGQQGKSRPARITNQESV